MTEHDGRPRGLDRRTFLRTVAVAGTAGALSVPVI